MVKAILEDAGSLQDRMQAGLTQGFAYYEQTLTDREELKYFNRLRDLAQFATLPDYKIRSTGYVVDTLEAAVWSLITTTSFETALLKAVNLGDDTDTVGAVAGGLGGLLYRDDVSLPFKAGKGIEIRSDKRLKPLCHKNFPFCRNYTIRAHIRGFFSSGR